jgi:hypothetical protein
MEIGKIKMRKDIKDKPVTIKMNYFFLIINCLIVATISTNLDKPRLCIDCKFFRKNFLTDSGYGKCSLFVRENRIDNYLVNGNKKIPENDYYFCSTARDFDSLCGKEGTYLEKKSS